jgi:hypothetical protein
LGWTTVGRLTSSATNGTRITAMRTEHTGPERTRGTPDHPHLHRARCDPRDTAATCATSCVDTGPAQPGGSQLAGWGSSDARWEKAQNVVCPGGGTGADAREGNRQCRINPVEPVVGWGDRASGSTTCQRTGSTRMTEMQFHLLSAISQDRSRTPL